MKKEFSVKKRTAFLAATLSAAMAFSAAPAVAETASDASTTATDASNESTTSDQEEQSTSEDSEQTNNGKTQEDSDTADSGNDKDGEEGKDGDGDGDKDKKSDSLDPTKGTWDKNGASSNPAPSEPFGSSGMNRLSAYLDSNHFKMITLIVTIFSAVVTVGSQLAAIAVTVSPAAKAQFDAFLNQLG